MGFHKRNSPSELVIPTIPFVGKHYAEQQTKILVFASAENLSGYWKGNDSLSFSTMCPGSPLWREQIAEAVEYAADAYGIDGIYFDQLGTSMHLCHNRAHLHGARTDAWCVLCSG